MTLPDNDLSKWLAKIEKTPAIAKVEQTGTFALRPAQRPPTGRDWLTWLLIGGRGSGKTRAGSEWVHALATGLPMAGPGPVTPIALVGETYHAVRDVMIDGPAGLLACARIERPHYEVSRRRLVWPNGSVAQVFSAQEPESLRGPQFAAAWCDELGCPAAYGGATEPNVFVDPKSSESALPQLTNGRRSDGEQRAFLQAHHEYWAERAQIPNSVNTVELSSMIDIDRIYVWAWDARPYPAFPLVRDYWGDGENWLLGHWMNGRLGTAPIKETINAILADYNVQPALQTGVSAVAAGVTLSSTSSVRAVLEPILGAFNLICSDAHGEDGYSILVKPSQAYKREIVCDDEIVWQGGEPQQIIRRLQADETPSSIIIGHRDPHLEYRMLTTASNRPNGDVARQRIIQSPCVLENAEAQAIADDVLRHLWSGQETIEISLPVLHSHFELGDVFALQSTPEKHWIVEKIERGTTLDITARSISKNLPSRRIAGLPNQTASARQLGYHGSAPAYAILDVPLIGDRTPAESFLLAPTPFDSRPVAIYVSPDTDGFELRATATGRATYGKLIEPLAAGPAGRWDYAGKLHVRLSAGTLASVSQSQLLAGRNLAALELADGNHEIIQFQYAAEINPGVWELSKLLRKQGGTAWHSEGAIDAGARLTLLDENISPLGLRDSEIGLARNWRIGSQGRPFIDRYFTTVSAIGGLTALTPLPPVHLRAKPDGEGNIDFQWIRQTRAGGDDWEQSDVPLNEEQEAYLFEIFNEDSVAIQSHTLSASRLRLPVSDIQTLLPAGNEQLSWRVAQLSSRIGAGTPAYASLKLD